ncbi:MAG: hypothetical protein IT256_03100 [Chitinophagaceae bacterium]|nr:hypothetical protein [Chitinophagaceae bacterium]
MYRLFGLLLGAFLWNATAVGQQKILVSGYITSTEDYCNGARPSDALLQELANEKPLPNKVIYIKTTMKNPKCKSGFKKITTDANGRFEINLNAGTTYYFIEEWKAKGMKVPKNTSQITWDAACIKERYNSPDYTLETSATSHHVFINYHKPCYNNPFCGSYHGPLRP